MFEGIRQLFNAFEDIISTFLSCDGLPAATSSKLLEILDDPAKHCKLKMQLAITVDAMEPLILQRQLNVLEGECALAITTYMNM